MKRITVKCALAIFALAAAPAVANVREEPVKVNVENLQSHVGEQVKRHADDSMDSLMQYLWFTRRIHHLWLDDVMKPQAPEGVAENETEKKREPYAIRTTGLR